MNLLKADKATLTTNLNLVLFSEMFLGPFQTSMMEFLAKIVTTLEDNYFHTKKLRGRCSTRSYIRL